MTPADKLAEALREYLEWGAMTSSDRDLHERAFRSALAAYDARNVPTVEEVAEAGYDAYFPDPNCLSLAELDPLERSLWFDVARAAARAMGVELREE